VRPELGLPPADGARRQPAERSDARRSPETRAGVMAVRSASQGARDTEGRRRWWRMAVRTVSGVVVGPLA
jgi:hypothetical protein